ncbi:hypothetical protein LCGC14_0755380 [marine sediment metagenome]|uniref:Uncharacterized protein n=1 Tax=marine sediment metagenome TaxID=412755 RepID=A0A0F9Q2R0_9ZZZZ
MTEKINLNKTNLRKIIKWSSSRYNTQNKTEVIEEILHWIKKGEDMEVRFGTGSFAEKGNLVGRAYILKIKNKRVFIILEPSDKTYELISKKKKSKIFIPKESYTPKNIYLKPSIAKKIFEKYEYYRYHQTKEGNVWYPKPEKLDLQYKSIYKQRLKQQEYAIYEKPLGNYYYRELYKDNISRLL